MLMIKVGDRFIEATEVSIPLTPMELAPTSTYSPGMGIRTCTINDDPSCSFPMLSKADAQAAARALGLPPEWVELAYALLD